MSRTSKIYFGLAVFIVLGQLAIGEDKRFNVSVISDGGGSWGRGKIIYTGEILVKDDSFVMSITNISKDVQSEEPRAVVDVQPFTARVMFKNNFDTVEMTVEKNGSDNKRILGSAYMLTYLVCENVIYPFVNGKLSEALSTEDESGQVVFIPRVPETVISKHFGKMAGADYNVGPVHPNKFFLLPLVKKEKEEDELIIGWFESKGASCQSHVRRLHHGDVFPYSTYIITATMNDKHLGTMESLASLTDQAESAVFKSYNRYAIHLVYCVSSRKK